MNNFTLALLTSKMIASVKDIPVLIYRRGRNLAFSLFFIAFFFCDGRVEAQIALANNSGTQFGAQQFAATLTNRQVYKFQITTTGSPTLTNVTFNTTGTATGTDITNFKLYYTTTNTFATTNLLNTITSNVQAGTPHTFSFSLVIPATTYYFWITTDLAAGAIGGNTWTISALNTTDVVFSGGVNPNSNTTTASGIQSVTPPTVTLSNTGHPQVTAANINAGTNDNIISKVRVVLNANSASSLTTLNFTTAAGAGNTAVGTTDITNFKLYYTTTNTFATTNLVATITTGLSAGTHSFTGLNVPFARSTTTYFWITADIAPGATNNATLTVSAITGVTPDMVYNAVTSYSGSATLAGTQTIVGSTLSVANNSGGQVALGNVNAGTNDRPVYNFQITSGAAVTLSTVNFTTAAGAGNTAVSGTDITNFKLYYSTTAATPTFGALTPLAILTHPGLGAGSHSFTGLTQAIGAGATGYFWITADIPSGATGGNTITVSAMTGSTDLVFVSGFATGSASAGGTQTITPADIVLSNNGTQVAAAYVLPNTNYLNIFKFQAAVTLANTTLTSINFTTTAGAGNTAVGVTDITNFKLYYTATAATPTFSLLTPLATLNSTLGAGAHTFNGFTQSINAGSTGYFWVTADIPSGATNNATLTFSILNSAAFTGGTVSSNSTSAGGTQTISVPLVSDNSGGQVIAGSVNPGTNNRPVYNFQVFSGFGTTVNTVNFTSTGTAVNTTDLSNFKLYYSATATTPTFSLLTPLATLTSPGLGAGSHSFTGFTQAIAAGATGYFWITTDIPSGATGNTTVAVSALVPATGVLFTSGPAAIAGTITAGGTQTISPASITLSNNGTQVAAAGISPNTNFLNIFKFQAAVTVANTSITQVDFTTTAGAGNTAVSGTDITNFKLFYTATSATPTFSALTPLATLTSPGLGAGAHSFTGFSQSITAGTTGYFWVTADIPSGATNNATLTFSVLNTATFTNGGTVSSNTTTAGGTQTVLIPTIVLSDNSGGQVTAGSLLKNSTNNVVYNFQAAVTVANAILTRVDFTSAGTAVNTTDLTNFKLYYTSGNTFVSPTLLGTLVSPGLGAGTHSFTGISQTVNNGSNGYFWITADIPAGATTAATVSVSAIATANVFFASGTPSGSMTGGGVKTIIAAPTATTNAASAIGSTTVTLNGTINANGGSTTVTFDYGLTGAYGTTVTATPSPVTGTGNTSVSVTITGLAFNTGYHFRVVGNNGAGTTNGGDLTFTTGDATLSTDYFRSVANGNWTTIATWQSSHDNATWITATAYPVSGAKLIRIQNGTIVNLNTSPGSLANGVIIDNGGALYMNPGNNLDISAATLTVNGTLNVMTNAFVTGTGNFLLPNTNCGGTLDTLKIGDPNGITTSPTLSGSIQVTGTRSFGDASYEYNCSTVGTTQFTGNALPATIRNLLINRSNSSDIVSLTTNNTTVQFSSCGGILTLKGGIFNIGSGNNFNIAGSGGGIANPNATGTANLATTGTNGIDGGTITYTTGGGGAFNVTGPGTTTFYNLKFSSNATFNNNVNPGASGPGTLINGTLTIPGNNWSITGYAPIYGAASTLYRNNGGQQYTPGLEWSVSSGTIGSTPGYPNNVTLVNIGSQVPNPILSGSYTIDGTFSAGDGTTGANVDLSGLTNFTCSGLTINTGSSLKAPTTTLTVKGNWLRAGSGTFNHNNGTVAFGGTGTCALPNTITAPSGESFYKLSLINGAYVSLGTPVTVSNTFTLTSGILKTTSTNILNVTNTVNTAVTGAGIGTAGSYVNGPMTWSLPASLSSGSYVFPVGETVGCATANPSLPFTFNPKTNAAVVATVQAFSSNSGGSSSSVSGISTTEYWSLSTSGALAPSSTVTLTKTAPVAPYSLIAMASSANSSSYTSINGTVNTNSISNSDAIGTASPWFFVLAAPKPVVTLPATMVTTTSATLNGSYNTVGVSAATSFTYGTSTSSGLGTPTTIHSPITSNTSVADSAYVAGLTPNTLYTFKAVSGVNTGADITFTTLPNPPTIVAGSGVTTSSFTANWTAPTGQGAETFTYTVEISTSPTFGNVNDITQANIASGTTSVSFTGLSPLTTYYVHVKAVNVTGSSTWSSTTTVTTNLTTTISCSSPANGASGGIQFVTTAPVIDGTIDATWSSTGVTSYNISNLTVGGSNNNIPQTWKAVWTVDSLYLLVQITDASLVSLPSSLGGSAFAGATMMTATSPTYWDVDGIELVIDPDYSHGNSYDGINDNQIRFNLGASTVSGQSAGGAAQFTGTAFTRIAPRINFKMVSTGTGYVLEAALPWQGIGGLDSSAAGGDFPPSDLQNIGFNFSVNDNDNAAGYRTTQTSWFGNSSSNFNNPSQFSKSSLIGCQVPPVVVLPTATAITDVTATLGATVQSAGNNLAGTALTLTARGTAYSTTQPVVSNPQSTGESVPTLAALTLPSIYTHGRTLLTPQTHYWFVGYATNSNNATDVSEIGSFWTLSSPPTVQPSFTPTASACSTITVNWSAATFPAVGVATARGYLLLRTSDGSAPDVSPITNAKNPSTFAYPTATTTLLATLSGAAVSYVDASVSNGFTYKYTLVPFTWNSTEDSTRNYLKASAPVQSATISSTRQWTGGQNTSNWYDPLNWCGGVPSSTTDAIIPAGLSWYPVINSGVAAARDITIQTGAIPGALTVSNAATLEIYGTVTNAGSFTASDGTIDLHTSSAIAGSMFKTATIRNLVVSNTAAKISSTPNDTLKISYTLSFGNINNATFTTGDNITLLSTTTNTARLADITNAGINSNNSISGKVVVERYIPPHRAWRLLTAPVAGQTILQGWQEGISEAANSTTGPHGYGTKITGTSSVVTGDGFDAKVKDASLYICADRGGAFQWSFSKVPSTTMTQLTLNTNPTVLSGATPDNHYNSYLIFVRGDRYAQLAPYTTPNSTVLRSKGTLLTGDRTFTLSGTPGLRFIGNPYASAIDIRKISIDAALVDPNTHELNYTIWDPRGATNGYGKPLALSDDGTGYFDGAGFPVYATEPLSHIGTIENGQAFGIYYYGGAPATIVIHEADKIAASGKSVFMRPTGNVSVAPGKFRINLYSVEADNSSILADGALMIYADRYQNSVNFLEDTRKLNNFGENLAIYSCGQYLAIEKRKPVVITDTIFLVPYSLKQQAYSFEFLPENMDNPALVGYLEDTYKHTRTPVSLNSPTVINIVIDGNPASKALDRFRIVFALPEGGPLPVSYSSIKAWQQNKDIAVEWKVENELNIREYEIETSLNGRDFTRAGSTVAKGNNSPGSLVYNWLDANASTGTHYYRIRSIGLDGKASYSSTVKVTIGNRTAGISIYPNPVKDGVVGLQLTDLVKGTYQLRLIGDNGQLVQAGEVRYEGGTTTQTFRFNKNLVSKGIYQLEVIHPDNNKTILKLINE